MALLAQASDVGIKCLMRECGESSPMTPEDHVPYRLSKRVRWFVVISLSIFALAWAWHWFVSTSEERTLGAWRKEQVAQLSKWTKDSQWVQNELASIQKTVQANPNDGATGSFTKNLILMKNGEWIAYSYKCCHAGARDLFIGRDQYGKWYYTNFHFCTSSMINLDTEDQSTDSLQTFVKEYRLQVFDQNSNDFMKFDTERTRTRN